MNSYKAVATITWELYSKENRQTNLEFAKEQLEKILDSSPQGENFGNFNVQFDLVRLKKKKKPIHIGEFSLEEVFPYITEEEKRREFEYNGQTYKVRMNSQRYFVFKNNNKCASCGLEGTKLILDLNPGDKSPHFNLYGEEDGRLVLMTKDHIVPRSKGGENVIDNYQTMCSICNNLKGNYDLTIENCQELRELHRNKDKITRKELRSLINQIRRELSDKNRELKLN